MKAENKISYYALRLKELLNSSFPELSTDKEFIERRGQLAAKVYNDAFIAGNKIEQCNEIAEYVLFEGLHFSKFDTVFKVVCSEFDTIMADEELRPFALKMLPVSIPVFEQYQLTDDFADSPEFELLYTELTGTIQIWIEDNGLQ
ncbi:DUF1896 domain-containing protein [Flavobacterium cupreum]|uniref:DUF1896 domain-containing protein n=2 Tax=Flavobacterium TaxID=237 RepID=A0A4Y7UGC8_9FLAO|nr:MULTISPECIES: DUF1896 domain-containing protein [Flavobacterium]RUT71539.1 DUF1896 domain-containing protein [Flavobacterium cupreum]TCN59630.1 uncharacterized protein DUF1896 [Flavobacterium circumlabens]TEB44902.1 DUF1896 domain-containing protein [Flavobacterium circumlabens]